MITDLQRATLRFIASFIKVRGYPPSMKDIMRESNVTLTAVRDRLVALERKGLIERTQRVARSIRITPLGAIENLAYDPNRNANRQD